MKMTKQGKKKLFRQGVIKKANKPNVNINAAEKADHGE